MNDLQKRSLRAICEDLDRRMANLEALMQQADHGSLFERYLDDLSPADQQMLREYFRRIRAMLLDFLQQQGISTSSERQSMRWAAGTSISFLHIVVAEMGPARLRGYGQLSPEGEAAVLRVQQELERLINQADRFLAERSPTATD